MLGGNSELKEAAAPSQTHEKSPNNSPNNSTSEPVSVGNNSSFKNSILLTEKNGIGIHTGRQSSVSILRGAQEGIHFSFEAEGQSYDCPALWERLSGTTRTTALVLRGESRRKIQVAMIEHFMAAAHIWRLDQIQAKIACELGEADTVEFPILDGSALDWCTSLAATTRIPNEQAVWVVTQNYDHVDGERRISFNSTRNPVTEYSFEGVFGKIHQKTAFTMEWLSPAESQLNFLKRIAPARTFGFLQEIEALRARGLALGGTLDNALVIDGEKFINKGGQRIENELASHKLLDAVGDLALAGKPIIGKIDLKASGHAFHLSALRAAFENGCLQPGFLMADGRTIVACSNI